MSAPHHKLPQPLRFRHALCVALTFACLSTRTTFAQPAAAPDLSTQVHSLKLVPADATAYSATLRIKEQWNNFLNSKAYNKLMQIPTLQMGKMMAEMQLQQSPEPAIAAVRNYLNSEAGKDALALVKEMVADEVFSYSSSDAAALIEMFMEMNAFSRQLQLNTITGEEPDQAEITKRVFDWLDSHKDKFIVPDLVAGFRIRDAQRATRHLDVLNNVARQLIAQAAPQFADRLKREQIGGREFLTLRVDGSLIPWDEVRKGASNMDDAQFDRWKKLISAKTAVLAIGVVDEFVIISLSDSTEHLAKLGQGPTLAKNEVFAKLAQHEKERIASISYGSGELLKQISSPRRSLDDAVASISTLLKQAKLKPELTERLIGDVRSFADMIAKYVPEPGAMAGISFLTPHGYESYSYNFGSMPEMNSSAPLTTLNHIGGDPLCFVAARGGDLAKTFDEIMKWAKPLALDLEKVAESQSSPNDWANYLKHRDRVLELLQRIEIITRDQVIPALKAIEQALVIDVSSRSQQWFAQMPKANAPLPILEIGLAAKVSDAALLRQGVAEYALVVKDTLAMLHEIHPDEFPEVMLPEPHERPLGEAMLYVYPLPAEWQIDSQLAPNAGLSNEVAVLSYLPDFTQQLLKPLPPTIETAIDLKRPAAVVSHFRFAKLVRAIGPWIDYGVGVATGQIRPEGADEPRGEVDQAALMQASLVLPQVHLLIDALSAIDSYTSSTYRENDVWVTHAEMRFNDAE